MKKDITTIDDIQLLVNTFYDKAKAEPLIGPIFTSVIQDRWPEHLEKMYRFWQTVLLSEHTYHGAPFPPHAKLSIGAQHFSSWLTLWRDTVDSLFAGDKANEAKWRGGRMAEVFQSKMEYFKGLPAQPLV